MSRIAQQLCDEIVEPVQATSSRTQYEIHEASSVPHISTKIASAVYHCPKLEDHDGKPRPTKSIIIEKKKVIKNLGPKSSNGSKNNVISRFKSSEILLKKDLADMAVNTVMSGSFRCDNHTNTLVRQRALQNNSHCKCSNKRLCNKTNPIAPKKSYSKHKLKDKACAQMVETKSCGTQFLENLKRENSTVRFQPYGIATQTSICAPAKIEIGMQSLTCPDIKSQTPIRKIPFRPFQRLDSTLESNVNAVATARRLPHPKERGVRGGPMQRARGPMERARETDGAGAARIKPVTHSADAYVVVNASVTMPTCVFKTCKNHSKKRNKSDGISYFHFPQNEVHRERWRKIVAQERGEEFFKANYAHVVCSDHFVESDKYITMKGLRRIKKSAIPHIEIKQEHFEEKYGLRKRHIGSSSTCQKQEPNVEIILDEEGESKTKKARNEVPSPTHTSPETQHLATIIMVPQELNKYKTETTLCTKMTQNNSFCLPMADDNIIMPVPVDFGKGGEFNPGRSSFIQQDRNVVMEEAQKSPDQATVLQNLLQCITPAVSPSTSIGSALDSPRKSTMRKDLLKCRQLILKKNKQINTLQKKTMRMKKKIACMKTAMSVLSKQKDASTLMSEKSLLEIAYHWQAYQF